MLLLVIAAISTTADAQAPSIDASRGATIADSAQGDTIPPDSTRGRQPVDSPVMYAIVAGLLAGPFAAAPFAFWIGPRGDTRMEFLREHEAAQLSVGGLFKNGQSWANAVDIESVRHDVHSELQVEDYWRPHHVRYLTLRGGPLWHPRRYSAGGVTLGYVYADGDPTQRGPELGLPLMIGNSAATMRFEPTYVFSSDGILWSYRVQLEGSPPRSPFFAGANMTWKSLTFTSDDRHDFAAAAVSLVVGARF